MICFPNAKINIGLNITEKRNDGYHNLETIFYPIPLCDSLEILENKDSKEPYVWTTTGLYIDGESSDNLCIKALLKLKEDYHIPPVKIHLHKIIPFGAGIGGGSADAAFTLMTLNTMFDLGLDKSNLMKYASSLGADCAFFIFNAPCFATGIGELLKPMDVNLKGYHLVLIKPNIHISTAEAFKGIIPKYPEYSIAKSISNPLEKWTSLLKNDFEYGIFKSHPELKELKELLYTKGASYASMTGSGAAIYGIFKEKPSMCIDDCFIWDCVLS